MTTTSDLTTPLIVLAVGAGAETMSAIAEAIPAGRADVVHVAELPAPPAPKEFIDLCILDDSGVRGDAADVVRRLRRRWPTVAICCVRCDDVVALFAAGADHAIPIAAPREAVVAQLSAALRRAYVASAQLRVSYGDVVYDREARRVWCGGVEVSLTRRELRLFDILFLRAGAPVSLDALQDYVWNGGGPPASNALAVYISYLRRKLRNSRLAVVETMRGVGYRLVRKGD